MRQLLRRLVVPPRQTISSEVQATLQMLAKFDLKIYGKVSTEALSAIQTPGFILKNGMVQKAEASQCEEEPAAISVKGKQSVREQLRAAAIESRQQPPTQERSKSDKTR